MKKRKNAILIFMVIFIFAGLITLVICKNKNDYCFNADNKSSYISMMYDIAVIENENILEGNSRPESYPEQRKSYYSFVKTIKKDDGILTNLSITQIAKLMTIDTYFGGVYHEFFWSN